MSFMAAPVAPQVVIPEAEQPLFRSDPKILCTALVQRSCFSPRWKEWKERLVVISKLGKLEYWNSRGTYVSGKLDLKFAHMAYISDELLVRTVASSGPTEMIGVTLKCKNQEGMDAYIRFILDTVQFEKMKKAIVTVAQVHNLDKLGPAPSFTPEQILKDKSARSVHLQQSTMRRSIRKVLKQQDTKKIHEKIAERRGAFRCLPVLFDNDLIHGSW